MEQSSSLTFIFFHDTISMWWFGFTVKSIFRVYFLLFDIFV